MSRGPVYCKTTTDKPRDKGPYMHVVWWFAKTISDKSREMGPYLHNLCSDYITNKTRVVNFTLFRPPSLILKGKLILFTVKQV